MTEYISLLGIFILQPLWIVRHKFGPYRRYQDLVLGYGGVALYVHRGMVPCIRVESKFYAPPRILSFIATCAYCP
jgi:hypothetical protein